MTPIPAVGGRTKFFVHSWQKLSQDRWVLQTAQGIITWSLSTTHRTDHCHLKPKQHPWTFTKILKPAVAKLGQDGIRMVQYLDDILVTVPSGSLLTTHLRMTERLLQSLGFLLNDKKCIRDPIEFLVFRVDSVAMTITLPPESLQGKPKNAESGSNFSKAASSTDRSSDFDHPCNSASTPVLPYTPADPQQHPELEPQGLQLHVKSGRGSPERPELVDPVSSPAQRTINPHTSSSGCSTVGPSIESTRSGVLSTPTYMLLATMLSCRCTTVSGQIPRQQQWMRFPRNGRT